ncbi:hypothetical protein OSB04_031772 [Centaurea solstitialis]|uniref:CCHC-type domain-containing protein n=1 Tax=Centaurea solstitialis TaxID=347529 RepID=A0AA38S9M5_9ASTR|nr:hypothetical protein OSB04_031772 [Centaurea solstitialis]
MKDGESLEDAYDRFVILMNDMKKNKIYRSEMDFSVKFINNLSSDWKPFTIFVKQHKALNELKVYEVFENLKLFEEEVEEAMFEKKKKEKAEEESLALLSERNKGKSAIKKGKSKVFEVVDDEDDEESEDEERDLMFQSLLTLTEAYRKKYYSKPNSNNRRFSSRGRGFTRRAQNQVQNFAPRNQGTYEDKYATKGVEEDKEVAEIVEEKKTNENITCFKCGKKDHVARICPAKLSKVEILKKKLELAEKQEQGLVLMADDEEWLDVSDTEDEAQMCFMGLMEEESDEEEEESSDPQTVNDSKFIEFKNKLLQMTNPIHMKNQELEVVISKQTKEITELIQQRDNLSSTVNKLNDSVNELEHLKQQNQSESQWENEGTLKPYVPTLELEKKISELENKIQELLEQNEVLISKNKNFVTWNSSETDSKSFVSDILNELVSSVSNSIFDIPDSNCDSETQDSSSKIYTEGLDEIQEDIIRVVTSDGYMEYKEPSAIASTDVVTVRIMCKIVTRIGSSIGNQVFLFRCACFVAYDFQQWYQSHFLNLTDQPAGPPGRSPPVAGSHSQPHHCLWWRRRLSKTPAAPPDWCLRYRPRLKTITTPPFVVVVFGSGSESPIGGGGGSRHRRLRRWPLNSKTADRRHTMVIDHRATVCGGGGDRSNGPLNGDGSRCCCRRLQRRWLSGDGDDD